MYKKQKNWQMFSCNQRSFLPLWRFNLKQPAAIDALERAQPNEVLGAQRDSRAEVGDLRVVFQCMKRGRTDLVVPFTAPRRLQARISCGSRPSEETHTGCFTFNVSFPAAVRCGRFMTPAVNRWTGNPLVYVSKSAIKWSNLTDFGVLIINCRSGPGRAI